MNQEQNKAIHAKAKQEAMKNKIGNHETDYQRRSRQRKEVKKYGITGATPEEARIKIKEHTGS